MKNMMTRTTRTLSLFACSVLLTTTQAWGFEGKHREMDWQESLNLTDEQEERIDDIEDRYRNKFSELRTSEEKRSEIRDERRQLQQAMHDEMNAVLTPEQKEQAQAQIKERHARMQASLLDRLSRDLNLSDTQRQQLAAKMASNPAPEWPGDKAQHDAQRALFNEQITAVLTDEQKVQWQVQKEKQEKKWRHHDEERFMNEEDCDEDEKAD